VVVTGLGLVTPLGIGIEPNRAKLVAGRSGIGPITRFDASPLPARIAGEVRNFDPECFMERQDVETMDVFIQYALAAAVMAVDDAALPLPLATPERTGVVVGVGMGGMSTVEDFYWNVTDRNFRRISPFLIPRIIPNMASGHIALRFGAP
jgi:3-oxoacyl-[acyl-carrier-protein] synthase II